MCRHSTEMNPSLKPATFLDFNFYPVTNEDIVNNILAPIVPFDIEEELELADESTTEVQDCISLGVFPVPTTPLSSDLFELEKQPSKKLQQQEDQGPHPVPIVDPSPCLESRFKPFHEEKWASRYQELVLFYKEHGHSAVPHTYPKNAQLARWVKRQRRQYKILQDKKPSTMTLERLELLNDLSMIWDSHEVNWREKFELLRSYRSAFGNCNVPSNFKDKKLATWVKCQRRQHKLFCSKKSSAMTRQRIQELEQVGFEWEIRTVSPRK